MNALEYKGYFGTVEYSSANNLLFGKVIGINSLISYEGDSLQSLQKDFTEAVDDYLSLCAETGIEPDKSYKGSFNVRVSPELHKSLAAFSAAHNQSLNTVVEDAIQKYVGKPAEHRWPQA